jgi:hypothetical protein
MLGRYDRKKQLLLVLVTWTDQKLNPADDKYASSSCYKEKKQAVH